VFALAVVLVMALAACGGGSDKSATEADAGSSATVTEDVEEIEVTGDADEAEADEDTSGGSVSIDNPYSFYKNSMVTMQSEGYEADQEVWSTSDTAGQVSETHSVSHIQFNGPMTAPEIKTVTTTETSGTTTESTSYFKDGYMYVESEGQKSKMAVDMSDLGASVGSMMDFTEGAIVDQSVTPVAGGTEIAFTIKGDALKDNIVSQMGLDALGEIDMTIDDVRITTVVNAAGQVISSSSEMSMSFNLGDMEIKSTTKNEMTNIKAGKSTIDFPTDLDSYTAIG
jgi:hypothetical protein